MSLRLASAFNHYSIVGLTLFVENTLVEGSVIELHNVADGILFADTRACALLKEYATSYFIT